MRNLLDYVWQGRQDDQNLSRRPEPAFYSSRDCKEWRDHMSIVRNPLHSGSHYCSPPRTCLLAADAAVLDGCCSLCCSYYWCMCLLVNVLQSLAWHIPATLHLSRVVFPILTSYPSTVLRWDDGGSNKLLGMTPCTHSVHSTGRYQYLFGQIGQYVRGY